MWIISKGGFVSLVAHQDRPDVIRARARKQEHLVNTFEVHPDDVLDMGESAPDYRWHLDVSRADAAQAMLDAVMDIDYTSHVKEAVSGDDDLMYSAMLKTWRNFKVLQDSERAEPKLPFVAGGPVDANDDYDWTAVPFEDDEDPCRSWCVNCSDYTLVAVDDDGAYCASCAIDLCAERELIA